MLPRFSQYRATNRRLRNAIALCQLFLACVAWFVLQTNGPNIIGSQATGSLWAGLAATALLTHIVQVLGLAPTKQVRRIAAGWIVACMAGPLTGLQWATFRQLKRYTVRGCLLAAFTSHAKHAIPAGCCCTGPRPASIGPTRLINMFPEAFGKPLSWLQRASWTAIGRAISLPIVGTLELRSAGWTDTLREHWKASLSNDAPRATAIAPGHFHALHYTMNTGFSA